jgi:hypothetical protein
LSEPKANNATLLGVSSRSGANSLYFAATVKNAPQDKVIQRRTARVSTGEALSQMPHSE